MQSYYVVENHFLSSSASISSITPRNSWSPDINHRLDHLSVIFDFVDNTAGDLTRSDRPQNTKRHPC
jgi:hypothetical protein